MELRFLERFLVETWERGLHNTIYDDEEKSSFYRNTFLWPLEIECEEEK